MSYLSKCENVRKAANMVPNRNIIVLTNGSDYWMAYSIKDIENIVESWVKYYIEGQNIEHMFCRLSNGLTIDRASLLNCLQQKVNTIKLVRSTDKFKQNNNTDTIALFYNLCTATTRKDIGSEEDSTFDCGLILKDMLNEPSRTTELVEHGNKINCQIKYIDKIKRFERWTINRIINRNDDMPSKIWFYANGKTYAEKWFCNGNLHRDNDKPAFIIYDEKGTVINEEWWKDGKPAVRDNNLSNIIQYDGLGGKWEKIMTKQEIYPCGCTFKCRCHPDGDVTKVYPSCNIPRN